MSFVRNVRTNQLEKIMEKGKISFENESESFLEAEKFGDKMRKISHRDFEKQYLGGDTRETKQTNLPQQAQTDGGEGQKDEHLYQAFRLMFEGTDTDRRLYLLRMAKRYESLAELSKQYPYQGSVLKDTFSPARAAATESENSAVAKLDNLRLWFRKNGLTDKEFRKEVENQIERAFWSSPTVASINERLTETLIDKERLEERLEAAEKEKKAESFQSRVQPWLMACFGEMIASDVVERNHRFLEEALELVQACGCTQDEAHQLVDYVYSRSVGERSQEVGGVMVTLAALCLAQDLDMYQAGETELKRIWTKVEQIRAKQAAKPKYSPLPAPYQPAEGVK